MFERRKKKRKEEETKRSQKQSGTDNSEEFGTTSPRNAHEQTEYS
jgi:hypothetical protein